jgi:hypothetical protein
MEVEHCIDGMGKLCLPLLSLPTLRKRGFPEVFDEAAQQCPYIPMAESLRVMLQRFSTAGNGHG